MADTPEGAAVISDEDLDDIVGDLDREAGVASDTADDSAGAADTGDEIPKEESETAGETEVGAEVGEEDAPLETAPETEGVVEAPAAQAKTERPFVFKGAGAEHALPGATELADGTVRIAKESVPQLKQLLGSYVGIREEWKTERKQLHRELRKATQSKSERETEAELITGLFRDVRGMTPEERYIWAQQFDENAPKLEVEIAKAQLAREREEYQRERSGEPQTEVERQEVLSEQLHENLRGSFQRLMSQPETAVLSPEDKRALWEKWSARPDRLVVRASKDMPEIGIKKGELYYDDDDIVDDIKDRIQVRTQAKSVLTTKQRNDSMNADRNRPNTIPPAVRHRPPVGDQAKKPTKPRDRKAFEKAFMKGELDSRE